MTYERSAKKWKSSKGANLVETAMVIPLLLLLTFAIIDFSTVLYIYLTLANGVSQATRYAVTGQQMNDPNNVGQKLSREESVKGAMRAATPTLSISDSCFQFYNLTKSSSGAGGPNDVIRVTVNYDWRSFTPLIRPFFNGQITLTVQSTMKNESFPAS
jgi:TadE-like protein